MPTINGKACVVNGTPVDKVFSDGKQVYGRNLVTGTSNELKTITVSGWGRSPIYKTGRTCGAGKYYYSAYVENTTPVGIRIFIHVNGRGNNDFSHILPAGQSGIVSYTLDVLEEESLHGIWVGFANSQTKSYTYKYKEVMITRAPSPWSPAPEDVM